jgi:hypothetical protein
MAFILNRGIAEEGEDCEQKTHAAAGSFLPSDGAPLAAAAGGGCRLVCCTG